MDTVIEHSACRRGAGIAGYRTFNLAVCPAVIPTTLEFCSCGGVKPCALSNTVLKTTVARKLKHFIMPIDEGVTVLVSAFADRLYWSDEHPSRSRFGRRAHGMGYLERGATA